MKKQNVFKWLKTITFFVLVFIAASAWQTRNLPEGEATSFTLKDLNSFTHNIDFSNNKKPTLLHFFATWCPICELENDSLNSISNDYETIVIAMQSGDASEVQAYKEKHQLTMTIYNDQDGDVARQYKVKGVPTSFIIAPNGQISSSTIGYASEIGLRFRLWISQL